MVIRSDVMMSPRIEREGHPPRNDNMVNSLRKMDQKEEGEDTEAN